MLSGLGTLAATLLPGWGDRRQARGHQRHQQDLLTGALRAEPFSRELQHRCNDAASDPQQALAVLCIDIDGFAQINRRHGRAVGDAMLRSCATRLQALLRSGDRLARIGGDQFAVMQRNSADTVGVSALVQRIAASLAEPHPLPGLPAPQDNLRLSASIGVALYGMDGTDAGQLLHHAGLALLRAKIPGNQNNQGTPGRSTSLGKAVTWSFHDATLDHRLQDRRALAQDLRHALAHGWLRLHYQPVHGADGRLRGYEALARWPHPTRGFVPPAEFIPVAETTGQIDGLGRWTLHAACAEAAAWPDTLSVAVNLSAVQCRQGQRLVDAVAAALEASGLAAARLDLEITERLLLQPSAPVLDTLQALRRLGVRIVMDDFGTGHASLACLWHLPFDKLKIDPSLTQSAGLDSRTDAVLRSIVEMARPLGIRVAAEGVENEPQRDALLRQGCDELQGHFLGRPAPAERLVHREAEIVAVLDRDRVQALA